jgi:predicted phage-related endonuclease
MQILELTQGTDEWLEARLKYLCASEAPAMMGDSKFMSRNQLLALKKGWQSNPVGDFKQRLFDKGHENEESARELLEMEMLGDMPPVVGLTAVDGLDLLSSFDGYGNADTVPLLWEHKDWNEVLAENVRNAVLEPLYYWQLEHQMLTAGADTVLFMVSDGTMNKRVSMVYESVPQRRIDLIAGWKQFLADLEVYEIEARQEVVVAGDVEALPSIQYKVEGSIIVSNIKDCLPVIKERAQEEMGRELETEQDFANKDKLNKATKAARAKLKEVVSAVQGEFVSYSEFAETAAEIDAVLQKMQSHGEKQVKEQKALKKQKIIDAAHGSLVSHIEDCDQKISPMRLSHILGGQALQPDFVGAMKNKRTIESWESSADEAAAKVKVEINQAMECIEPNLAFLREHAEDYKFLFNDTPQIINQAPEAFSAIVKQRIADHKQAEEERLGAERKRIREEEEAKAKRDEEAAQQAQQEPAATPSLDQVLDAAAPEEVATAIKDADADAMVSVTVRVPESKHSAFMSLLIDQLPVDIESDTLVVIR